MEVNIKAREESHTTSHGNALSIPTCLVMHFSSIKFHGHLTNMAYRVKKTNPSIKKSKRETNYLTTNI
jgi:hypothetical protein